MIEPISEPMIEPIWALKYTIVTIGYGPKVLDGLTFEGGYTGYVATGDGDYLTNGTLWDFKVSKQKLQNKYTLQLFMYWRVWGFIPFILNIEM